MEKRYGRQSPASSYIIEYTDSKGKEAIDLYNKSGRIAFPWQELMIYDIMAVNPDGLWTHLKFGYSVPRRNGKTEDITMRALWGLVHGERILYTAHRTTTSHSTWEKMTVRSSGLNNFVICRIFFTFCPHIDNIVFLLIKGHRFCGVPYFFI